MLRLEGWSLVREEGRGKREEGRGKREEGRGKREEGKVNRVFSEPEVEQGEKTRSQRVIKWLVPKER